MDLRSVMFFPSSVQFSLVKILESCRRRVCNERYNDVRVLVVYRDYSGLWVIASWEFSRKRRKGRKESALL